jgi:hypothetical protein
MIGFNRGPCLAATFVLTAVLESLASSGFAAPASAPTSRVYRCGPDGHTYSQTPCPAGSAVDASDPRSAAEQAQARSVVEREQRLARQLAQDRAQAEKAAARQLPGNLGPAQAASAAAASAPKKGKHKPGAASAAADTSLSPPVRVPGSR